MSMHFYPTSHVTCTASDATCSEKPSTIQFSHVHDTVGKNHPDELLLNSSLSVQKNYVSLTGDNSEILGGEG